MQEMNEIPWNNLGTHGANCLSTGFENRVVLEAKRLRRLQRQRPALMLATITIMVLATSTWSWLDAQNEQQDMEKMAQLKQIQMIQQISLTAL